MIVFFVGFSFRVSCRVSDRCSCRVSCVFEKGCYFLTFLMVFLNVFCGSLLTVCFVFFVFSSFFFGRVFLKFFSKKKSKSFFS